ncbi:alpha/beta fold hydrolase [Butyrivibrio sp. AE3004]|uniref:alpha/beta fold hydrolase n=1 Tax=Butyrivibrio sp. AE3004 TaxID=1506994 RepID=UPI00049478E6|nr:alpha/beta hydrolase [Butyrivibrio sp. AE3004]
MIFMEYGPDQSDTIILLHGGGLSWWNYREIAELLQGEYHIILPILDGHAGSDRPFTTIEENAEEIIRFIDEKLSGSVLLIGGLSLGGQILLEMLSKRKNLCSYALAESAAVIPSKLTNMLIAPTFGCSYGLIKNRSFSKLQFQSLHIKPDLFENYYRDTCQIKKQDMIAFMKESTAYVLKDSIKESSAIIHVYVGEKEKREILLSAKAICRIIPSCKLHQMDGLRHGEFSINHADRYANAIRQIVKGE